MLNIINVQCKSVIDSMSVFDDGEGGDSDTPMTETELLEMVVTKMSRLVEIM